LGGEGAMRDASSAAAACAASMSSSVPEMYAAGIAEEGPGLMVPVLVRTSFTCTAVSCGYKLRRASAAPLTKGAAAGRKPECAGSEKEAQNSMRVSGIWRWKAPAGVDP
jgi:hypothetical protein